VLTDDAGRFVVGASSVAGSSTFTATAEVDGERFTTSRLKIIWAAYFNNITLAVADSAGRRRVPLAQHANLTATVTRFGAPVSGVPVNFKVSWVSGRVEIDAAIATADAAPAAVLPFTKQAITNADGQAVLLRENPKRNTPGTYRVMASATSGRDEQIESNPVLVTWHRIATSTTTTIATRNTNMHTGEITVCKHVRNTAHTIRWHWHASMRSGMAAAQHDCKQAPTFPIAVKPLPWTLQSTASRRHTASQAIT
jgi:hypothetical protein